MVDRKIIIKRKDIPTESRTMNSKLKISIECSFAEANELEKVIYGILSDKRYKERVKNERR